MRKFKGNKVNIKDNNLRTIEALVLGRINSNNINLNLVPCLLGFYSLPVTEADAMDTYQAETQVTSLTVEVLGTPTCILTVGVGTLFFISNLRFFQPWELLSFSAFLRFKVA